MTTRHLDIFARYAPLRAPDEGGAASSPAIAPDAGTVPPDAAPASAPPSPSSDRGDTDTGGFGNLGATDDLDFIDLPADTGPKDGQPPDAGKAAAPSKDKPQDGTPPPAADPKKDALPPTPPSPAPKDTAPAATPPAAASPDLSGPEGVLQGLEAPESAKALTGWLAQNVYALTDAEKAALDTDAVGAIPALLARGHLEATKNTLKLISTLVPQMVQAQVAEFNSRQVKSKEALSDFYKSWPSLKAGEHDSLVGQFSKMYRAQNPQATRADAIKFVGAAISAHLGLAPVNGGQSPAAATPSAPPFAPARPGARQISSIPVDQTPFAGLGQEFDED